ncbi:MAG: MXAN_5187 C-terminal domain-containing protein [Thermoanaerobaculia bacterium]
MTPEETNNLIEDSIKRLKTMYDMFFAGTRKLPPTEDRRRLDQLIRETSKLRVRDNAQRFRFSTLVSRYNQYQELWGRLMREREEGPVDYRRRSAALGEETPPPEVEKPPEEAEKPPAPNVTSRPAESYVTVALDGSGDSIQRLCAEVQEAHNRLGKNTPVNVAQIAERVRQQAQELSTKYNVAAVAFRVETVDGKVKLRAKPVQEKL